MLLIIPLSSSSRYQIDYEVGFVSGPTLFYVTVPILYVGVGNFCKNKIFILLWMVVNEIFPIFVSYITCIV